MSVFNAIGLGLAGFLAFSVLTYLAVVGGVLAHHHGKEAIRRRRGTQTPSRG